MANWLKQNLARDSTFTSSNAQQMTYDWNMDNLLSDQKEIVLQIMFTLKQWIEWDGNRKFWPLRLTVRGKPGTGKSVVIKTIRNICYHMFSMDSCVQICAPTGGAAYNAGGQTCHRQWGISRNPKTNELSSEKKKYICKTCINTLILIIDEFSLLDAYCLGAMENNIRQSVYSLRCNAIPWGGIPVVVLFGDVFQLPSISPGAFEMMDPIKKKRILETTKNVIIRDLTASGWKQFIALAECVLTLTIPKRVDTSNKELLDILDGLRGEDPTKQLQEHQIQRLLDLRINNSMKFSMQQQQEIIQKSMCLFATKENNNIHNRSMLLKLNRSHPVCICKSITMRMGKQVSLNSHYDADRVPACTVLVKNAIVQLSGWNAKPEWGLFHTSLGKVIDIVYKDGESPTTGHLPYYILVDFQLYIGPPFDTRNPTYVPVPTHVTKCKYNCGCERMYVPLTLAFGKTIHSFQGQNVGPTRPGQPENPIKSIVVDLGPRSFEGSAPALAFSICSRATTLGDPNDLTTSALFFNGNNMNRDRIQNITCRKDGLPYAKVALQKKWNSYLTKRQNSTVALTSNVNEQTLAWIHSFHTNLTTIQQKIHFYSTKINS